MENLTLRGAREKAGLNQKEAAELMGITARTLRRWEKQDRLKLTKSKILLLAVTYGIDSDEMQTLKF